MQARSLHTEMAETQNYINDLSESIDENLSVSSTTPQKSNALSNKLSGVLSASYADSEIRDTLRSLDEKKIKNTAETRRKFRLDVQKEIIRRNGAVVQDFGHVAEVRPIKCVRMLWLKEASAIEAHRHNHQQPE